MKRVLKTFAVIGGIAAVAWAMRDRFLSIPTPREEEPSPFRVPNGVPPSDNISDSSLNTRD